MGEFKIFSIRIKELREMKKMTQTEFSSFLGIKQQTLSGYERGSVKPPLDIAKDIAEKCGVSLNWLCGLPEQTFNITTYSDVIQILFLLRDYTEMEPSIDEKENDGSPQWCDGMLLFSDRTLDDFITEWAQALNVLYNTKINEKITKSMYESWKNSKIEEFRNKKIKKPKHIDS